MLPDLPAECQIPLTNIQNLEFAFLKNFNDYTNKTRYTPLFM